jgi:hypothetical protein
MITCFACPSQWEGKTVDGREFYARYRWGTLTVEIDGEVVKSVQCGEEYDGVMSTNTMLEISKFVYYGEVEMWD